MLPLQHFTEFIKKNALFTKRDKILLAVSGGKDSVLMAHLFKLAGFQFSIAHCNFNLRADESQRDEAFVKLLAVSLSVPFYVAHFDTKTYADQNKVSTQMAARELRYEWFEQVRVRYAYHVVALAHHQNDSIETIILNLTRGTGISGMHGILPKRYRLVRPLLFLSRQEIDEIVALNHLDFVTDSSNESEKYARNKIRLHVIPHLQELNPNLAHTFQQNALHFAETEEVLRNVVQQLRESITREEKGDTVFLITAIEALQPQKLLFFELLRPFNFAYPVVLEILESLKKQSGTSFYSSTHRATIDRERLLLSKLVNQLLEDQFFIYSHDECISIGKSKLLLSYGNANALEADRNKAFVPAERLIFPLIVRYKQNGDRFMPLGMNQHKKLSDFFIDEKVPVPQKDRIPLLINGNGEIIWVLGLRQDNRYKVNATTKKVAIFELSNQ